MNKKIILIGLSVFSSALIVVSALSSAYIKTNVNGFTFDFKTGQPYPLNSFIYITNTGDKARFDMISKAPWMLAFYEGNRNSTSVTVLNGNSFNFVIEVHPENLDPGIYYGSVNIKAVNIADGNTLDSKDIPVTLKKDYVEPSPTPISTSTPTPTPSTSSSPSPQAGSGQATPASQGFISLSVLNLMEGDVVSATDDPDIYIVNGWGYRRLFLNPVIFGFYGHLGGFASVKNITSVARDMMVASGLFRNCEANDIKIYGLETTGEDTGIFHWVNITGEQAVAQDMEFFKKVFCINNNEFNWYSKGLDYTSVSQIPEYSR